MKLAIRVALYLLFVSAAVIFLMRFRASYHSDVARSAAVGAAKVELAGGDAGGGTNASPVAESTNSEAGATNAAVVPISKAPAKPGGPAGDSGRSRSFMDLALFLVSLLAAGFMAAWDVVNYLGSRAGRSVMAEDYSPPKDAAYDEAEEQWAKGNHLDAIGLMREYLKKRPNQLHVSIRIAEIYEKDLNNYLAAVLELEDVLSRKLPPEKWGWTAIHLANIYSGKLNQPAKAMGVLERIAREHPAVGAAKKARQRLGWPEPEEASPAAPGAGGETSGDDPNMPRGFSAKK